MYRIRLHGRGGQGIRTASRALGTAFFQHGYTVQDAPRYGAERRGAPVFAYVRAARQRIDERGLIVEPDLVVVADETLTAIPAAGVREGAGPLSVLLISTFESAATWRTRLNWPGPVVALAGAVPADDDHRHHAVACAGAAARLTGVIAREVLVKAITLEYASMGPGLVRRNSEVATAAYDLMAPHHAIVAEGPNFDGGGPAANWIAVPRDPVDIASPSITAALTSVKVKTGLWRVARPVIDDARCHRCWWICSTFCPDNAIAVAEDGRPEVDYDHCKGCMICAAQCPAHAISVIPERAESVMAGGEKS